MNKVFRKKNRIVLVRHNNDPLTDRVFEYFASKYFDLQIVHPFQGEEIGEIGEDLAGTVIYGGPQSVTKFEESPFLKDEGDWIEKCLKADVPILGICLGAQQIAHHLGAKVGPNDGNVCEFGYYEITPTDAGSGFLDGPLHVAQSHDETFDIPAGATHLARSDLVPNQAFRYGQNAYGFQFHAEVPSDVFKIWQDLYKDERKGILGVQSRDEQNRRMRKYNEQQGKWFLSFLENFFPASE